MEKVLITKMSELIVSCIQSGGKVLTFGVGGNAANAIHFGAELSGKYKQYDNPLPCICLCENPAVLTAITNDFGWDEVFSRQIQALGKPGDVVIAFSISTKGLYLQEAIWTSMDIGCLVILVCGRYHPFYRIGWEQPAYGVLLELDSDDTPWVQEEQLRIIHQICGEVKKRCQYTIPSLQA